MFSHENEKIVNDDVISQWAINFSGKCCLICNADVIMLPLMMAPIFCQCLLIILLQCVTLIIVGKVQTFERRVCKKLHLCLCSEWKKLASLFLCLLILKNDHAV